MSELLSKPPRTLQEVLIQDFRIHAAIFLPDSDLAMMGAMALAPEQLYYDRIADWNTYLNQTGLRYILDNHGEDFGDYLLLLNQLIPGGRLDKSLVFDQIRQKIPPVPNNDIGEFHRINALFAASYAKEITANNVPLPPSLFRFAGNELIFNNLRQPITLPTSAPKIIGSNVRLPLWDESQAGPLSIAESLFVEKNYFIQQTLLKLQEADPSRSHTHFIPSIDSLVRYENFFDAVILQNVGIEETVDLRKTLEKSWEFLKPDGCLVILQQPMSEPYRLAPSSGLANIAFSATNTTPEIKHHTTTSNYGRYDTSSNEMVLVLRKHQ